MLRAVVFLLWIPDFARMTGFCNRLVMMTGWIFGKMVSCWNLIALFGFEGAATC